MRLLKALVLILCAAVGAAAQGGRSDNVAFKSNVGVGGVNVAVCAPLATTAASVSSNLVTLTMSANPVTAGFAVGMTIQVAGFTGGDTYLNIGSLTNNQIVSGATVLSVTPTTIVYALTHANASASTNGTVLQEGNATTSCGGLASLFTDSTLGITSPNPFTADGYGNYGFWAASGIYQVQVYGASVVTAIRPTTLSCVPTPSVSCGVSPATNIVFSGNNTFTGANTFTQTLNTQTIIDQSNLIVKGPDPYADITAFGARATTISSTASCNGTTTITSAPTSFVNGDGLVVWQCGAAPTMSTPSAPSSVTSGGSNTETVPDAVITSVLGGANTYSYLLVGRDETGGLTVPSAATAVTTSQFATLGPQTFTMTSESQVGSTLTITLSSASNISAGNLVHAKQSTNAALSGWFIVSSVSGGGTILTINNVPTYTTATIASTGGQLIHMAGNKVAWTGAANVWEYLVCGKRPGDGAFHIIGVALPNNNFPSSTSTFPSSYTFTDFGSTITSVPSLPAYIADANCTAVTAQNQYLATTVVSGGGTSTLVLTNPASQTVTGATVKLDNGPALLAAATSAAATGARVYIPPIGTFQINSFTDLSGQFAPLDIAGTVTLNETFVPWRVLKGSAGSTLPQFGQVYTSGFGIGTAWPGVWAHGSSIENVDSLNFNCNSTQCISFLWDNDLNGQNGFIKNSNFSVDTYSGIGLMIRPQAFNYLLDTLSFGDAGPTLDTTWTPALYIASCQGGCTGNTNHSTGIYQARHLTFARRMMYTLMWDGSGANGPSRIDGLYGQGGIMPAFAIQNTTGGVQTELSLNDINDDSSPQPLIANFGGVSINLSITKMGTVSAETGGTPPNISGVAPLSIGVLNDMNTSGFAGLTTNRGTYGSLFNSAPRSFYANDFFDTGTFNNGNARGILDSFSPVVTRSGSFVGLGLPVQAALSLSAGASPESVGPHTYCIAAVGWNGGWGPSSCQSITVTTNNQIVNFTWTAVASGQGYVVIRDGRNCVPAGNANCTGLSFSPITATSGSYSGSVAGCCGTPINPDIAGDGVSGFDAGGLFGSQFQLFNGAFKGTGIPTTLTANRTYTFPDSTGTISETIALGTSAMPTGLLTTNTCATAVTTSATGTAATDTIIWSYNAAPGSPDGLLTITAYPTTNNVNFLQCNTTSASQTPVAATLNWKVVR